jgi:hypothetical protein
MFTQRALIRIAKYASPFALSAALFACFSAPPLPPSGIVASEAVQSHQVLENEVEINLAPNVLETQFAAVRPQNNLDGINELLARYVVVLRGDLSQAPAQPLTFSSACAGRFAVTNPNPTHAVLTWRSEGGSARGSLIAAAGATTAFEVSGATIGVFLGNTRLTTLNPSSTACTDPLPAVPGGMTVTVLRVGNTLRVRLPPELLPGERFTLFLAVTPPFAFSATRVLSRDEQREQAALQDAWKLVANDPRLTTLGLSLDTGFIRGVQIRDAAFMVIPDGDLGFVQLSVQAGQVVNLERWAFFADGSVIAWNLLNGVRADFGTVAGLLGLRSDPAKHVRFLEAYTTLYDPDPDAVAPQASTLAVECSSCDGKLDLVNKQVRAVIAANAEVKVNILDSLVGTIVGCVTGGVPSCLKEALFNFASGIVVSQGSISDFAAAFGVNSVLNARLADLRVCQADIARVCIGGFTINAQPAQNEGFAGDYITTSAVVENLARYARLINVYIEGQATPVASVSVLGRANASKAVRFLCPLAQRFRTKLIGIDTAPGNVLPELRRAEGAVEFDCQPTPTIRMTGIYTTEVLGLRVPGVASAGERFGMEARLERGSTPGTTFQIAGRLRGIDLGGYVWNFIDAKVLSGCVNAGNSGVLESKNGESVEESLGTVFRVSNAFLVKIGNNCDHTVVVNVRSKTNPQIKTTTPLTFTTKAIRVTVNQGATQFSLEPGQNFLLPRPRVDYDATRSGYRWDPSEDPRQRVFNNELLIISRDTPVGTIVRATVRSVANPNQLDKIDFKIVDRVRVTVPGAPYQGPDQNCARVKAQITSESVLGVPENVQVYVDGQAQRIYGATISSDGKSRTYSVTRSCNLDQGTHDLRIVYLVSGLNQQSQQYDERTTFRVADNRWPGIQKNGAYGCNTPSGAIAETPYVVYRKNNPSEGPVRLGLGEIARQTRYGNTPTTYNVTFEIPGGNDELTVVWEFKTPFDGDPQWYGYFSNIAHWLSCGSPDGWDPEGTRLLPAGNPDCNGGPCTQRAPGVVRPQSLPRELQVIPSSLPVIKSQPAG